jgi:hypothetical protein
MKAAMTIFTSPSELAKEWRKSASGEYVKTTAASFSRGTYETKFASSASDLVAIWSGITTHEALCCSTFIDSRETGRVVTVAELANNPGAQARTKALMHLSGPGLLFIDCDEPGISRDQLWQMLVTAAPALAGAAVVWRPSGSSHIWDREKEVTGLRGHHLAVLIADAADGPRVLKALAVRLWLANHGLVKVSAAGSLLVRCPIDLAVGDVGRLLFLGGASCSDGLEQRRGPPVILADGGFLDSRTDIADLSADELGRYEALVTQAKAAAMPEALLKRSGHRNSTIAKRLPAMLKAGVSAVEAEKRIGDAVDAALVGVLLADHELTVVRPGKPHEIVTVGYVLSHPDEYHEADVLDPLHPGHRGGAADGRLFLFSSSPIVYSLDDGGKVYRLLPQKVTLNCARGSRHVLVAELAALVSQQPDVFMTDSGPVLLQRGRCLPLTVDRLMNLSGSICALFTGASKPAPTDLTREIASLVLAALALVMPTVCH